MDYEVIIGLEVHVQLLTKSKMFCSCSAAYAAAPPNTHVCPVCLGMPGVLPVINKKAIEYTIMTALALNCTISEYSKFDRKNYPYPDLMKGYQISQYDSPVGKKGWLNVELDGQQKKLGITRVHLEEDVAKLLHRSAQWGEAYSLVDVNRSGVPLMEVVGEPDIRSAEEARQYLIKLHSILQYLGVSTGNMEDGSFRCDANISLRPVGVSEFLTKTEVKNMNSFKAVYRALEYEAQRQKQVLESGDRLVQETRGWVEEKGITVSQRSKEYAHDYRYFPEPDLPPLTFSRQWVEELHRQLPELPDARRERFMTSYGLSAYDASLLISSKSMANYFETCLDNNTNPKWAKAVSNWLLGEFSRLLNLSGVDITETKVKPQQLVELLQMMEKATLSGTSAKEVFQEMFNTGKSASQVVAQKGLTQISDSTEIDGIITQALVSNAQAVADFKAGKAQALTFLLGQVMRASRGRANPQVVRELLQKRLADA